MFLCSSIAALLLINAQASDAYEHGEEYFKKGLKTTKNRLQNAILKYQGQTSTECFQLKLHWHKDDHDDAYCAECSGSCKRDKSVNMKKCDEGDEKQYWKWEHHKLVSCDNDDLCIDYYDNRKLRLKSCGTRGQNQHTQKFHMIDKDGDHFELKPLEDYDNCLTNSRKLGSGESLRIIDCDKTNEEETHFWIIGKSSASEYDDDYFDDDFGDDYGLVDDKDSSSKSYPSYLDYKHPSSPSYDKPSYPSYDKPSYPSYDTSHDDKYDKGSSDHSYGNPSPKSKPSKSTYDHGYVYPTTSSSKSKVSDSSFDPSYPSPSTKTQNYRYGGDKSKSSSDETSSDGKKPTPKPVRSPTPRPRSHYQRKPTPKPTKKDGKPSTNKCFQLKLHWKKEYYWQKSKDEKAWCASCNDKCKEGKSVRIKKCDDDDKKQWWKWEDNKIKSCRNDDLCVDYDDSSKLRLRDCGSRTDNKDTQAFTFLDVDGDHFELHPYQKERKCLTNPHHPKPLERLILQDCKDSRRDETNFWITGNDFDGHP